MSLAEWISAVRNDSLIGRHHVVPFGIPFWISLQTVALLAFGLLCLLREGTPKERGTWRWLAIALFCRAAAVDLTLVLAETFPAYGTSMPAWIYLNLSVAALTSFGIFFGLQFQDGHFSKIVFSGVAAWFVTILAIRITGGSEGWWAVWFWLWGLPAAVLASLLAISETGFRQRLPFFCLGIYFLGEGAGRDWLSWYSSFNVQRVLDWDRVLEVEHRIARPYLEDGITLFYSPIGAWLFHTLVALVAAGGALALWDSERRLTNRSRHGKGVQGTFVLVGMVAVIAAGFLVYSVNYNAAVRTSRYSVLGRLNALAEAVGFLAKENHLDSKVLEGDPALSEFLSRIQGTNGELGRIALISIEGRKRRCLSPKMDFGSFEQVADFEQSRIRAREPYWFGPLKFAGKSESCAFAPVALANDQHLWLVAFEPVEEFYRFKRPLSHASLLFMVTVALLGLAVLAYSVRRDRELRQRYERDQAALADRVKTELLATLSHDLRTPLQAMLTYCDLLAQATADSRTLGYAKALKLQTQVLHDLLQNLLQFSAAQMGFRAQEHPFLLREVLGRIQATMAPLAAAKGLEFRVSVAEDVPDSLKGDAGRLYQILLNLLGNGVRYTSRGSVSLEIKLAPNSGKEAACALCMSFVDTGPGLPQERRANSFALRVESPGARQRESGFGIGLALVEQLCHTLGGNVKLVSSTAEGTHFCATLPFSVYVPEGQPGKAATPGRRPTRAIKSILLVEDHDVLRTVQAEALTGIGFVVTVAESSGAARRLLDRFSYDAALIDLGLPDEDGRELAQSIRRKNSGEPSPWLIALTAARGLEMETEILKAGFDAFLAKPVELFDLQRALQPWGEAEKSWLIGGEDLPAKIIFDAGVKMVELKAAVEAGNRAAVVRLAHYLQNSALVLGWTSLDTKAEALRRLATGTSGGVPELKAKLDELEAIFGEKLRSAKPV